MRYLIWNSLLLVSILSVIRADSWMLPTAINVESEDQTWSGTIHPASREDLKKSQFVRAALTGPKGEVSYRLDNQPTEALLLNNGKLITFDNWASVGYGDNVLVLYDNSGKLLWKKSLEDLIGKNPAFRAPTTTSSIWWRSDATPAEVDYSANTLSISLWNENMIMVNLKYGSSVEREVKENEFGDNPERLMNRAKSLSREDKNQKATQLYKRVITLDPTKLYAYIELARCNDKLSKDAETIEILSKGYERFKEYSLPDSNIANFHSAFAQAYLKLSKTDLAEKHLREAVKAGDAYYYPVSKYISFLKDQNRAAEIDAMLLRYYHSNGDNIYKNRRAAADIGDYYFSEERYDAAVEWYERIHSPESIHNQFAYYKLAQAYETLGRFEDALKIHQQLIRYWEEKDTFWKRNLEQSKIAVHRLSK